MKFITTILFVLAVVLSVHAQAAEKKPNILLILADDLGYSDIGCFGGEIDTPALDSLAKNGLRFTQFYNTARCWPTRGALLSGYYAQQIRRDALPNLHGGVVGTRQNWAILLPEMLKPAGYRSYISGKWHIDGNANAAGFDHSLIFNNDGNFYSSAGRVQDGVPLKPLDDESKYFLTDATADHAIECLQKHAKDHADQPFFQYIAFHAPHFPLHAPQEDIKKYEGKYLSGWETMRTARHERQLAMKLLDTPLSAIERDLGPPHVHPGSLEKLGPNEINRPLEWNTLNEAQRKFQATKMAIHAAMVDRMDRQIARVIAQLKAMNAYENTMIVFLSDNGASAEILVRNGGHDQSAVPGSAATYLCLGPGFSSACNTPFRRHKTWVHEGGISSPCIVHWPAGIAARGELRHTPAHVVDFVPTALAMAGVDKAKQINGKDVPPLAGKNLVPAFSIDTVIPRDSLWWMHEGHRAIRVGDWKLVAVKDSPWELYDLSKDRAEQNNFATKMPDKVKELSALWQQQADEFTTLAKPTKNLKK